MISPQAASPAAVPASALDDWNDATAAAEVIARRLLLIAEGDVRACAELQVAVLEKLTFGVRWSASCLPAAGSLPRRASAK